LISKKRNNPAKRCVKCGACTTVCPVYRETGRESHTARGKHQILEHLDDCDRTGAYDDLLSKCLLCGACREVCSRDLETPRLVIEARSDFSKLSATSFLKFVSCRALTNRPLLSGLLSMGSAADRMLSLLLPEESGLRLRMAQLRPESVSLPAASFLDHFRAASSRKNVPSCSYFVGCLANHLKPEIGSATAGLVDRMHGSLPKVPGQQSCCGMAALAAGDLSEARQLAKKNIAAFESDSLPILTSCGSCYSHLLSYPDLFDREPDWQRRARDFAGRLREFSCFFNDTLGRKPAVYFRENCAACKVLYHDPCHLRFGLHITAEPRQLLVRLPGVILVELENGPQCCGQGGLFHIIHPDIGQRVRDRLMADYAELEARTVVSTCSGCLLQWQQALAVGDATGRVVHPAVLMEEYLL
jgi:glycolate oxidase iron-sulfur subunit